MKKGTITPNGVSLERHENDTIIFFTNMSKNIELIPPSNTPHNKSPDFIMDHPSWEMKSPEKAAKIIVERALHDFGVYIHSRGVGEVIDFYQRCFTNGFKDVFCYFHNEMRVQVSVY